MRVTLARAATLVAVLSAFALPAAPARRAARRARLLSIPGAGSTASLYYTDPEYDALAGLVGMSEPSGTFAGQESGSGHESGPGITVTWLVHDVEPWRVDRIYLGGKDGPWISTQVSDFSGPLWDSPVLWHRPADGARLADLLDGLGLGTQASKDTSFDGVAGAPVPPSNDTQSDETNAALPAEADTHQRRPTTRRGSRAPDGQPADWSVGWSAVCCWRSPGRGVARTLPRGTVVPRWDLRLRRGAGPLTLPVACRSQCSGGSRRGRRGCAGRRPQRSPGRGDAARMTDILADDFTYTDASGVSCDRDEYVASYVGSPDLVWLAQESSEPTIRVFGDAAIVTLDVHDRATWQGQPFEGDFRSLFVYVRRDGAWRCVAGQTTSRQG